MEERIKAKGIAELYLRYLHPNKNSREIDQMLSRFNSEEPSFQGFRDGYEEKTKNPPDKSASTGRVSRRDRDYEFSYRRGKVAKSKGYEIIK